MHQRSVGLVRWRLSLNSLNLAYNKVVSFVRAVSVKAVPKDIYETFLCFEPAKTVIERYQIFLIIYNPNQEVIEQWIK